MINKYGAARAAVDIYCAVVYPDEPHVKKLLLDPIAKAEKPKRWIIKRGPDHRYYSGSYAGFWCYHQSFARFYTDKEDAKRQLRLVRERFPNDKTIRLVRLV